VGPQLGDQIVSLSNHWRHVHLIGHSAGCWVLNEAAKIVAERTDAEIHMTFLDAYVPDGWDGQLLGRLATQYPERCWIDHYFTRDPLGDLTENRPDGAHNVDISAVNPGHNAHRFCWHWYLATVTGRYAPSGPLAGEPLFLRVGDLEYGYGRSLEAGLGPWQVSTQLPPGPSAIEIMPR
jgi:hypothetical protein